MRQPIVDVAKHTALAMCEGVLVDSVMQRINAARVFIAHSQHAEARPIRLGQSSRIHGLADLRQNLGLAADTAVIGNHIADIIHVGEKPNQHVGTSCNLIHYAVRPIANLLQGKRALRQRCPLGELLHAPTSQTMAGLLAGRGCHDLRSPIIFTQLLAMLGGMHFYLTN